MGSGEWGGQWAVGSGSKSKSKRKSEIESGVDSSFLGTCRIIGDHGSRTVGVSGIESEEMHL